MNETSPIDLRFNVRLEPVLPSAKTFADIIRAIDTHIMACGPTNATRVDGLFDILEHCGELLQLLDAMPDKGEGKLRKALNAADDDRIAPLEKKWLERFDAFRIAQRETSSLSEGSLSRAEKMAAAIGHE